MSKPSARKRAKQRKRAISRKRQGVELLPASDFDEEYVSLTGKGRELADHLMTLERPLTIRERLVVAVRQIELGEAAKERKESHHA